VGDGCGEVIDMEGRGSETTSERGGGESKWDGDGSEGRYGGGIRQVRSKRCIRGARVGRLES